jgi:phosphate transport system permease protein
MSVTTTATPSPVPSHSNESRRALVRATARRSLGRRRLFGRVAVGLCGLGVCIALAPLVALVAYTTSRGIKALSVDFFTKVPTPPGIPGGGISNAIVGSGIIIGLAAAMAIPTGIACALFLLERRGRLANAVRFAADVLVGIPSIAVGIFVYALFIAPVLHRQTGLLSFSAFAGSIALAVLMLPIVIRSSEAAMRAVPRDLWEAGLALGIRRPRVVRSVVLRGALPGLVTGNLLALARVVGETAPLLFTAFGSQLWNISPFRPTAALSVVIFTDGTSPEPASQVVAWGTAFVLLLFVLILSISARAVAAGLTRRSR